MQARQMQALLISLALVGPIVLSSTPAAGALAVRLVDPAGVDSGGCAPSPCLTVNYAIAQANPGDTIQLAAGNYNASIIVNKAVTITGPTSGPPAIVSGGDNVPGDGVGEVLVFTGDPAPVGAVGPGDIVGSGITIQADDVTISHLSVTNFGLHGITGLAPRRRITIDAVDVSNNGWYSNAGRGIFFISTTNTPVLDWGTFRVTNSTFTRNRLVGVDFNSGTADDIVIEGNVVRESGDSGITLAGGSNSIVRNNTVSNNGRFGIEVRNSGGPVSVVGNDVIGSLAPTATMASRWPAAQAQKDFDYAGIVVYRRGPSVTDAQVDQPAGSTIMDNRVRGYLRVGAAPFGSANLGQGHGVVVEGTGNLVTNNAVWWNDVGLQFQSGQVSNTTGTDGFDRGDASAAVGATITGNTACANRVAGARLVGASSPSPLSLTGNRWFHSSGPTVGASRLLPWAPNGSIGPDNIVGAFDPGTPAAGAIALPGVDCLLPGVLSVSVVGDVTVPASVDCVGQPGFPVEVVLSTTPTVFNDLPTGAVCTVTLHPPVGVVTDKTTQTLTLAAGAFGELVFVVATTAAPPTPPTPPQPTTPQAVAELPATA
jgi:parallel beta-helix repeat protein